MVLLPINLSKPKSPNMNLPACMFLAVVALALLMVVGCAPRG
jgi:hypothetical protein